MFRIPPLVMVVATALVMWLAAWLLPWMRLPFDGRTAVALVLAIAGGSVSWAGVVAFRRARVVASGR